MGGVWASGSPPESSISTPQRRSSAATRRPNARSGVMSAAVFPGVSNVSRIRKRDCTRLFALRRRGDERQPFKRRIGVGLQQVEARAPERGRVGGAQRFREKPHARTTRRRRLDARPERDIVPFDAKMHEQLLQPVLRMGFRPLGSDCVPAFGVEFRIEPRQHNRTCRKAPRRRREDRRQRESNPSNLLR